MSAIDAIDAVYARLQTVPGVGPNVYSMVRGSIDDDSFQQIFVDATTNPASPIVNAWQVTREDTTSKDEVMQAMSRTHNIVMTGFMSWQDGVTEPIFQALIEAVCGVFDPYAGRHFSGKFDWSGPTQVQGVKLGILGSVMVHTARLIYPVREFPL